MLRAALFAALVALATAHYHGGIVGGSQHHGLNGLLLPGQIRPAIGLLSTRYAGISPLYAAQIIRHSILQPRTSVLSRIGYSAVPALNLRLGYLRSLYGYLPSQTLYSRYASPLSRYLGGMGIRLSQSVLANPLSLVDYYAGINQVGPINALSFNRFFTSGLLGLTQPRYTGYRLPALSYFVNRLNSYRFSSLPSYFSPLGGLSSASVSYSGPGSSLLPVYSSLGLPYPSYPGVTLGGLHSYLRGHQVPFNRFTSFVRSAPLSRLVNAFPYGSVRTRISARYPWLTRSILRRDLLPLWAARYHAYPQSLRRNLYFGRNLATFNGLVGRYVKSRSFPVGSVYNQGFFSSSLNGFDNYIGRILHRRRKSWKGGVWASGLGRIHG